MIDSKRDSEIRKKLDAIMSDFDQIPINLSSNAWNISLRIGFHADGQKNKIRNGE